jgi:hypothetical protein
MGSENLVHAEIGTVVTQYHKPAQKQLTLAQWVSNNCFELDKNWGNLEKDLKITPIEVEKCRQTKSSGRLGG